MSAIVCVVVNFRSVTGTLVAKTNSDDAPTRWSNTLTCCVSWSFQSLLYLADVKGVSLDGDRCTDVDAVGRQGDR